MSPTTAAGAASRAGLVVLIGTALACLAVVMIGSGAAPARAQAAAPPTTTTSLAFGASIVVSEPGPLRAGQAITVTGHGFEPGAAVRITECGASAMAADLPADCDVNQGSTASADDTGSFSVPFVTLVTNAPRPNQFESGTAQQCPSAGTTGCVLVATDLGHRSERSIVPIALVPYPPPPPPTTAVPILRQAVAPLTIVSPVGHLANTGGQPTPMVIGVVLLALGLVLAMAARRPARSP